MSLKDKSIKSKQLLQIYRFIEAVIHFFSRFSKTYFKLYLFSNEREKGIVWKSLSNSTFPDIFVILDKILHAINFLFLNESSFSRGRIIFAIVNAFGI